MLELSPNLNLKKLLNTTFAADFGNKTKKVELKRGEVTTTKLVEMGDFVTSLQGGG